MNNLAGQKGNFIQPLVAAINCSLWVYYGLFKKERDIPLAAANAPGIIFWPSDGYYSFDLKGTEETSFQSSFLFQGRLFTFSRG